jgi:integrase
MSKRGNGEGSIGQRPDGRWEARVVVGRTPKGNPKRRSVYGRTRKEVATKLQGLLRDRDDGKLASTATTATLEDYLRKWLNLKTGIEKSTRQHYSNMIEFYIARDLGGKKLTALKPLMIQEFLQKLRESGKGLVIVRHAYRILRSALKQAVLWQLLSSNPTDGVTPPPKGESNRQVWDKEQTEKFLNAITHHRLYAMYLLVLAHGLRRGELLGLRWQAVDLEQGRISIEHTSIFVNGKRTAKDSAKSVAGNRTFSIIPEVIDALKVRYGEYLLERDAAGVKWQETGYVFCSSIGTGLYESTLREIHDRLIAQAGVPRVTLHELRHTYTSLVLLAGADVKEVSRRLGHASTEFTRQVYQHLYPEQDKAGAVSLSRLLGKPEPDLENA